jgi:hypothetical protein
LAPSEGSGWRLINDGEIDNRGFELEISAIPVETKHFSWQLSANAFLNRNKILDIAQPDEQGVKSGPFIILSGDTPTRRQIGQPLDVIWGYEVEGIIQEGEVYDVAGLNPFTDYAAGEFKYVDRDGNNILDDRDKTIIGDTNPKMSFGLTNNFSYKKFSLSVLMYGSLGADIYNARKFEGANQLHRWTPENPTNDWPSLRSPRFGQISDWWVENGSFVRISNVQLSYDFDLIKVKRIGALRVYAIADNLAVFTNYSGYDPGVIGDNAINVDIGGYPRARSFSMGLNVTFQ